MVEQLFNFQKAYEEATQEIKGITSFFKNEAKGINMRLSLFSDLKEVKGYSWDEHIMVGKYISKDSYKVDYFFTLPKKYRRDYIWLQLIETIPIDPHLISFCLEICSFVVSAIDRCVVPNP